MKQCLKCKAEKPLSEFYNNKSRSDGHECYCISCVKPIQRAYRQRVMAEEPEKYRGWVKKHLERLKKKRRENPQPFRVAAAAYRNANRERINGYKYDSRLRNVFGINRETYNWMLSNQGGVCALCRGHLPKTKNKSNGQPSQFAVDHDHDNGRIRGLLCGPCNMKLGWLEQVDRYLDRAWIDRARQYVAAGKEEKAG